MKEKRKMSFTKQKTPCPFSRVFLQWAVQSIKRVLIEHDKRLASITIVRSNRVVQRVTPVMYFSRALSPNAHVYNLVQRTVFGSSDIKIAWQWHSVHLWQIFICVIHADDDIVVDLRVKYSQRSPQPGNNIGLYSTEIIINSKLKLQTPCIVSGLAMWS